MSALKGHVQLVGARVRMGDFPQAFPQDFGGTEVWYRDFRTVLKRELENLTALASERTSAAESEIEALQSKLDSEIERVFQHLEDVDSPTGGEFNSLVARMDAFEETVSQLVEGVLDGIELENYYTKTEVDALVGTGGGGPAHKVISMPSDTDANGIIAYSGFATDFNATTDENKWAVKKQFQDGAEEWAGKTTFNQILDNYLSLTYA